MNLSYLNNIDKINMLDDFRNNTINNMSSKQLKILLNKLGKNDNYLKFLKLLLDIEDTNINAKKYSYSKQFKQEYYMKKDFLLKETLNYVEELNINYGIGKDSNCHYTNNVIYFDLININKQISWHFTSFITNKIYNKEWDKIENATIPRILSEIELYCEKQGIELTYEKHIKGKKK